MPKRRALEPFLINHPGRTPSLGVDKAGQSLHIRAGLGTPHRSARGPVRGSRHAQTGAKPVAHRRRNTRGRFVKGGGRKNPPRRHKHARRNTHHRASSHHARRRNTHHRNPVHRRRHARRNPPAMSVKGITGGIFDGVVNGGLVVLGQVVARKIRGAAQGMLPAATNVSTGMAGVLTSLAGAVGVSIATGFVPRKLLSPARASHVIAGAFSEAWNQGLAQTPIAPYMSAFPRPAVVRIRAPGVRGYVQQPPRTAAMSGYVRLPVATTGSMLA